MTSRPDPRKTKEAQQRRGPNFDRVARLYRWAEYLCLGPLLQRTRLHFLRQVSTARTALMLGDGDGRFLAELLRQSPALQAIAVDSSARMLALLHQRCAFAEGRVHLRQGLLPLLPADLDLQAVDLVVTHFVLDCLAPPELATLTTVLAAGLRPGALWLVSDFGVPERQPWRGIAQSYIRLLYLAFRLLTGLHPQRLPPIEFALCQAGFSRVSRHIRLGGFLYSELWRLGT